MTHVASLTGSSGLPGWNVVGSMRVLMRSTAVLRRPQTVWPVPGMGTWVLGLPGISVSTEDAYPSWR